MPEHERRGDLLVESLSVLAEVLRREGHRETAREILVEAETRLPKSWRPGSQVLYWHRRGLLCRDLGQRGEALTAFSTAAELAREQGRVEAEGEALVRQAEMELSIEVDLGLCDDFGALRTFSAVLTLGRLSPSVSLLAAHGLGMALVWMGREQEAMEALTAARQRHRAVAETPEYIALVEFEGELLMRLERLVEPPKNR